MSSGILEIENMSSGYGNNIVLQDISFSLKKGEVLAVIGQNGCGKSTLLKTIARVITDNTGHITFSGIKLDNKNTWDLKQLGISWFVQGGMVFPTLKVSEHFDMVLRGVKKEEKTKIKKECLDYFPTLVDYLDRRGGNLSGGQRQMLSFAMLLAQQTDCWLLDEPTAGLSPEATKETTSFLQKMKGNKTMILVEHNYDVAFELADKVVIIKDGKLNNSFKKEDFLKDDFLNKYLYN